MGLNIAALILTKNEDIHIERCILSINKLVSKIYVIDSGKIAAEGNHDELLKTSEIYNNFYKKQLRKN